MPAVSELLPPRYGEPREIGRGGMGTIYLAHDTSLDRPVAIKVLDERFARDESVRARFTREALAAARLSRAPSTVTIFDVGEWHDRPYIVMEHLAGGSLADRLRDEGAQPPARALAWLEEAAAALDAAHAAGVVHRDVKPANLLLDEGNRVHVADFGIASAAGLDSTTAAGTVLGTAGYLAPEQARAERATPASDCYALAAVAFELLTGTRPFEAESPTAEAAAHVTDEVPSASARNPDLPRELDAVLARGLSKEPSQRFDSCHELVQALRDALDRAAGQTNVLPVVAHRRPRSRVLAAAGVVGLLGAAGAAAAVLATRADEEQTPPRTLVRTVTQEGTTATIVTTAPAPAPPPPTTATTEATATTAAEAAPEGASAVELSDRGRDLIREGRYDEAIPPIEQALSMVSGSGYLVEAYASYNLAFARLQLGRCDDVGALLDRSEQIQGPRKEIDRLRREAQRTCG